MILQDYLHCCNANEVIEKILELYHLDTDKSERNRLQGEYKSAIQEMIGDVKPHVSDDFVLFFYPLFEEEDSSMLKLSYRSVAIDPDEFQKSMPIPLFGECHRSVYHYNIALTDWKEILGYEVYDLDNKTANMIALANVIHEMTWYGKDYVDCKANQLKFFSYLEAKLLNHEEQIAFEQVFEEIGINPHHPFTDSVDNLKEYENHLSQLAYVRAFNKYVPSNCFK